MKKYLAAIFFLLLITPVDYVRAEACMGDGVTYNQYLHAFNQLASNHCNPPYTYPRDFCVILDTSGNPVNLIGELVCVADTSALPPIGGGFVPDPNLDAPLPYADPLGNPSIDFLRDGINNLWETNRNLTSHVSQDLNARSNRLERLVDIVGGDLKARIQSVNETNNTNADNLMSSINAGFTVNRNDRNYALQPIHQKLDSNAIDLDIIRGSQINAAHNLQNLRDVVDDVSDSLGGVGDATRANQTAIMSQIGRLEGTISSQIGTATGTMSSTVSGSTATITSAIGSQTGQIMSSLSPAISQGFDGVNQRLDALEEGSGDGLTAGDIVDAFGAEFQGDAPSEGLGGFYERRYDSLESVFNNSMDELRETPLFDFVDSFSFDAAAEIPSWTLCFDLGIVNFGCSTLEVPPHVWSFIRIVMLLSASFLARKMIIGG